MKTFANIYTLGIVASLALSQPALAAVKNHNQIVGFSESATLAEEDHKPKLLVSNGCVPFPSVDAAGDVGGGLTPTGATDGQCSSSTGQIYARQGTYGGVSAIMYAWYFPKDQPIPGAKTVGHRHDWECVIVWQTSGGGYLAAISYSAHGGFSTLKPGDANFSLYAPGGHPLADYFSLIPVDHALSPTTRVGGTQPMIDWNALTGAARQTLNTYNYGAANVPFNDTNFQNNLRKAYPY